MNVTFVQSLALTAIPFALGLIALIIFFFARKHDTSWLRKILLAVYFMSITALLLVAVAKPLTVTSVAIPQPSEVTVLFDTSESMGIYELEVQTIEQELQGVVPFKTKVFGSERESPVYQSLLRSLKPYSTILLTSDGRDTYNDVELEELVTRANEVNAVVAVVNLTPKRNDNSITLLGPQTTITGVPTTYDVFVDGEGTMQGVVVRQDGVEVYSGDGKGPHSFQITFEEEKTFTFEAEIIGSRDNDYRNNKFYKTTRIIPKPPVLYVGNDAQTIQFLDQFTDVTSVSSVPRSLDDYTAAVFHNVPNSGLQSVDHVIDFVASGNGLVVLGGDKALDLGNYDRTPLTTALPVTEGKTEGITKATVVLVIDISASSGSSDFTIGSTNKISDIIQILSYDITQSLGGDNLFGVIAFYQEPVLVSPLQPLGTSRQQVLSKIERLRFDGTGTQINAGLSAAWKMLEQVSGAKNIILITDAGFGGGGDSRKTSDIARGLAEVDIPVYTVFVGSTAGKENQQGVLQQVAKTTGGTFVLPDETETLNVIFGDIDDSDKDASAALSLVIADDTHPITNGMTDTNALLSSVNYVIPKQQADLLATTTNGDPALISWRYGLGRTVVLSAFTGTQQLGGLLAPPDSRLLARSVSYAVGDPEKKLPPQLRIDDTRLGDEAIVTATGPLPSVSNLSFSSVSESLHTTTIRPTDVGIQTQYGATFAVAYQRELQYLSIDPRLEQFAKLTGGKVYNIGQLREIKELTDRTATVKETQPVSLQWIALVLAGLLWILLLVIRKIEEKRS